MIIKLTPDRFNLSYYWYFVVLATGYLLFGNVNTPEYSISVITAFVTAGIVLHAVQYRILSLVSLLTLGHIVQYPLAALIILSLPSPTLSIEPELWPTTPNGMWAMSIGMMSLVVGIYLAKLTRLPRTKQSVLNLQQNWYTPVWFNCCLVLLGVPVILFYISQGIYYHKNVQSGYNISAANTFGFIGYFIYVTYVGGVLQLKRYLTTKTKKDLFYCIGLHVMMFVMYGPSGARRFALLPIIISFLFYLHFETNEKIKKKVFLFSIVGLALMLPVMEAYRSLGVLGATGFVERLSILFDFLLRLDIGGESNTESSLTVVGFMLGRRLGDFISVGYIMSVVPDSISFLGMDDILQWPAFLFPTLIRPDVNLSYVYDALYMEAIGFRPLSITGGSSPMMLIGDMFARGGVAGICIGMTIVGFVMTKVDQYISQWSFRSIVVMVLMMDSLMSLHSYNVLKVFVLFTRHFLIYYIIGILLETGLIFVQKITLEIKQQRLAQS